MKAHVTVTLTLSCNVYEPAGGEGTTVGTSNPLGVLKWAVTTALPEPNVKVVVADVELASEPLPLTVQLLKAYPDAGVAVMLTVAPGAPVVLPVTLTVPF